MRIAILESITTPGGHEVDFDRILVEELQALGHEVALYVPEKFTLPMQYGVPIHYLVGEGVSYTGLRGIKKAFFALKREINRQRWYRQMYQRAGKGEFDAIIVPTSTYRYLRALNRNVLQKSPVPVIFIIHGINPGEASHFFREVDCLLPFSNIKMAVLTFGSDILGRTFSNMSCIRPPAYIPRDIDPALTSQQRLADEQRPLRLGFFGQYRREKKLDKFLDAFLAQEYTYPVKLLVQGATMRPEDTSDFERIIAQYSRYPNIEFLHRGLFGLEWQSAIASVDALLMPYAAPRYRYHWAGMLFTAIGYQKPVVVSDEINPEVLSEYNIGCSFSGNKPDDLHHTLKKFINTFPQMEKQYRQELLRAYQDFSPRCFMERLVNLCQRK